MNTLDLDAYGVSEMTTREMQQINGGIIGWVVGGLMAAWCALDYYFDWGHTTPLRFVMNAYDYYFN